jgi:hypothetical protein
MRMAITDRVLFAETASQALGGASQFLLAGSQLRAAVQWMESREYGNASHEQGITFRRRRYATRRRWPGKSESSLAPDEL